MRITLAVGFVLAASSLKPSREGAALENAKRLAAVLATESANRERQRMIDQKMAILRKMPLGPEQQAFAKEQIKEIEALRADNAKIGAALKNLVPPAPPRDR